MNCSGYFWKHWSDPNKLHQNQDEALILLIQPCLLITRTFIIPVQFRELNKAILWTDGQLPHGYKPSHQGESDHWKTSSTVLQLLFHLLFESGINSWQAHDTMVITHCNKHNFPWCRNRWGQSLYWGSARNNCRPCLSHTLLIYLQTLLTTTLKQTPEVHEAMGLMDSVTKIQQPSRDGCQIPLYNLQSYLQTWEMEFVQMRERQNLAKYAPRVKGPNQDKNASIL